MNVLTQRASLKNQPVVAGEGTIVDLWSIDDSWRHSLAQAAREPGRVVVLSSLGIDQSDERTHYDIVMSQRESHARTQLPDGVILRIAPIVEDVFVYDQSLRDGQVIHHAYADGEVAWLCAKDVLDVAGAALSVQPGSTFDVAGPQQARISEVLTARAEHLHAPPPECVDVPADVLIAELSGIVGKAQAEAVVGYHVWAAGLGEAVSAGQRTLAAALGRPATPWQDAVTAT